VSLTFLRGLDEASESEGFVYGNDRARSFATFSRSRRVSRKSAGTGHLGTHTIRSWALDSVMPIVSRAHPKSATRCRFQNGFDGAACVSMDSGWRPTDSPWNGQKVTCLGKGFVPDVNEDFTRITIEPYSVSGRNPESSI